MSDLSPAERYVLDGTDEDLRRLLGIAEVTAQLTRSGLDRAGIQPGWRVLDCGCGPIGALPILAELVGPSGHVIGVDVNQHALDRAAHALRELQVDGVELVAAAAHELDPEALGGPLDLIYTRCFLMHQPDPLQTIQHLVSLLAPGGVVVAHEPLASPGPRSHPPVPALEAAWTLLHDIVHAAGVPDNAVEDLPARAAGAGLEVAHSSATWILMTPAIGFELHAGTLEAARARAVQLQLNADDQIDGLVNDLRSADPAHHQWVTTPLYLDLTLRPLEQAGAPSGPT